MCGIVGVMSCSINMAELDAFYDLSAMATHRGRWGGGVIAVQNFKKKSLIRVARTTQPLNALTASERFREMCGKDRSIVVGHARWPTMGGSDIKSVHPHVAGHITGVHNGTMSRVGDVSVGKDQSDSAMVFRCIAEKGVDFFVKNSYGAYALVWIDDKDGTINFLRNDQRPLYAAEVGWNNRCTTLYFASERQQLDVCLSRHYKNMHEVKINFFKIHHHYKFPLKVAHDVKSIEIVDYTPPPVEVRGFGDFWKGYDERQATRGAYQHTPRTSTPPSGTVLRLPPPTRNNLSVKELAARAAALLKADDEAQPPPADGNDKQDCKHGRISQKSTMEHVTAGLRCCWCSARVHLDETIWPVGDISRQRGDFLCDDCIDVPEVTSFLDPEQEIPFTQVN